MQRIIRIAFLICCFVFSKQNFSQDIRGGWIEYKWISGYTYSVTTSLIIDSTLETNRPSIFLYDCIPSSNSINSSSIVSQGKFKIILYTNVITTSGPGSCFMEIQENFRVPGINNITNSGNQMIRPISIININPFLGPNSCPTITNKPISFVTTGTNVTYNPGCVDPDGDSLSYKLVTGQGSFDTYIPYNASIDSYGILTFPKDSAGLWAFTIQIVQWRKDAGGFYQSVGEILLDFVMDVNSSIGIKEYEKTKSFSIYPNPTSNILTIKTNSKINSPIEIINCLGEIVLKQNYSETINVSKLNPGVYFIKVDNSYSKFIKE